MTINRTTLLDLPLPVTGTEAGTWGDVTNNGLTEYLDIAIAGMVSLTSSDFTAGALTISTTEGNSSGTNIANSSAQYATLKVSSLAANSTITAPASARAYRVINADATYTLTVKASGQTGVTFQPGTTGMVAFNGTDYEIVGVVGPASATDNAVARFDGTTGQIVQNSGVTIDDSNNVSGVAQLNATTADLTNIEVTNIKAKDGTAAASIADATGVMTIGSSVLTTTDINGGTIDGTAIGASSASTGAFTTLSASSTLSVTGAGTIQGLTVGRGAGAVSTNTAVGASALNANTTGATNTALGYQSLQANTTASNNTAVGYQAGYSNTSGSDGTFIGYQAGYSYSSSSQNGSVFVGKQAGYSTTGQFNTFVGFAAGYSVTTGVQNTFVGPYTSGGGSAGGSVTTGSKNTILGAYNGNQNNLDIRTASNYAVISDGDGTPFLVHRKDYGLTIANRSQIASAWEAIQNKSQINMYEGTNGNFEIASGYSTSDFVVGTGGTTGNVAYGANGGSYLSVASGIMAIIGSTFTIGSNTYTVTSESSEGYVYCSPDASGEAATGTLVGLKYATEGFRVYDNRTAQFKSTVGVGGTAGSTSGAGITFPATQNASSNANTLDDYEEGTWTPTVGGNAVMGIQAGDYIKIGKLVWINFDFSVVTLGTGSNKLITGLPFPFNGGQSARTAGSVNYFVNLASTASAYYLQVDGNGIYLDLNNAASSNITDGPVWIQSGTRIMGTIMYQTSN